jgi:hypothetical protein
MKRKSFNIEEQQLRRVASAAEERGVTVNEFIRLALAEKIERQRDNSSALRIAEDVSNALGDIRKAMKDSEGVLVDDLRLAVAAIERQQGEFIAKQQELLKQFLLTLGHQLAGKAQASAGYPSMPPWGQST